MATAILRLPDVKTRTGLSRSTIYFRVSQGLFPSPISLGARAVGWVEGEIQDWIETRIAARPRKGFARADPHEHAPCAPRRAKLRRRT